ncbi:hypothetical protein C4D60_Mb06t06640 [Musa balbisiana]|uniref:Uncharacterized protein n=1 Tax=Musa balbisiana TaxID=52838 RepID=A0A4S8IL99_MUSBA|nr:hypothetical protein C4D60_Mb06t06640 [Musa balbisiana]
MESSSAAKRLWHIVKVVFYMHRKSLSMHKLMVDLHLLLKRGKNAGKALGQLVTFHHHGHLHGVAAMYSGFSCRPWIQTAPSTAPGSYFPSLNTLPLLLPSLSYPRLSSLSLSLSTYRLSFFQMESSSAAKRLWHIVKVVFYMHRKSLSMHKLMVDLHLLLKRGKNAG